VGCFYSIEPEYELKPGSAEEFGFICFVDREKLKGSRYE